MDWKGSLMCEDERLVSQGCRTLAFVAVVILISVAQANAQFNLSLGQRALDGTVYEVVAVNNSPLFGGADQMRVTTIAGSVNSVLACSSGGSAAGQPMTASSGTDPLIPAVLHDYHSITRTGVLSPNNLTVGFDPSNGGRLTLGTGAGAIEVCRNLSDCAGGAGDAGVFDLSTSGGGVPAACIANTVTSTCSGSAMLSTLAFGLSATGDPPNCSGKPTTNTTVCAMPPVDGFTVGKGQAVVFIYNHSLGMSGFSYGVSGFGVDLDAGLCGVANRIITADGQAPSAPPPITIFTPTATGTASNTPTPTGTPTISPTSTTTSTPTSSPTVTPLPCGNGMLNTGEQCDDGNRVNGDGCDNNCTFTACGNGIVTAPEQCDDGNRVNGDGCDNNCTFTACGNGIVTAPEQCDDGNRVNGDGCDNNCTPTGCGNGILTPPEQCDDGNRINGDGCDSQCRLPTPTPTFTPTITSTPSRTPSPTQTRTPTHTGTPTQTFTPAPTRCSGNSPDLNPGYCNSEVNDCLHEWCTQISPEKNSRGLPSRRLECRNNDPTCDHSLGDDVCAFQLSLCFNVPDKRFPCISPNNVVRGEINRPGIKRTSRIDKSNRDSLIRMMRSVGASSQGTCVGPNDGHSCSLSSDCDSSPGFGDGFCPVRTFSFTPALTANVCSDAFFLRVGLTKRGTQLMKNRQRFRVRFFPAVGFHDGDLIDLICLP
ncbi:MAG: DUF4215 domain-containing protein [Deltaproteobacteria bacterium]|nr:DUF4215 domain-containing protein [Deltaproteobacteria bacterium]